MHSFGLIGFPLGHSFSRNYFREKFEKLGLADYTYENFPLSSINELPQLLSDHPFLEGLNVTIPYKKAVLPFLDERSFLPEGLEACNCIRIRNGRLSGFNTDVIGFENSLRPLLKKGQNAALILGNGGAAVAIVYVLKKLGILPHVVSRKKNNGADLDYSDLNEHVISEHKLIINTTPLGLYPDTQSMPAIPYQFLGTEHLLYDLIYNPAETLFLRKGKEQGTRIKNGEEMLIIQAEESWKVWNQ